MVVKYQNYSIFYLRLFVHFLDKNDTSYMFSPFYIFAVNVGRPSTVKVSSPPSNSTSSSVSADVCYLVASTLDEASLIVAFTWYFVNLFGTFGTRSTLSPHEAMPRTCT